MANCHLLEALTGYGIAMVNLVFNLIMNIWEMLAGRPFPWRCLCSVHVPKKVPSLVCAAMLNKNLIIGNLVKGGIPLINWCCVCKASNESVGHLLLHCAVAHNYGYYFSRLLGGCSGWCPKKWLIFVVAGRDYTGDLGIVSHGMWPYVSCVVDLGRVE